MGDDEDKETRNNKDEKLEFNDWANKQLKM